MVALNFHNMKCAIHAKLRDFYAVQAENGLHQHLKRNMQKWQTFCMFLYGLEWF
jgi:hypothetical protein